jgi:hypothetical protein
LTPEQVRAAEATDEAEDEAEYVLDTRKPERASEDATQQDGKRS